MKHSTQPGYEVSGDLAEVETIDLLALIPPTLDGMTKSLFVDLITRLAALEERDREREEENRQLREEIQQQNLRMDALSRRGTVLAERMERIEESVPPLREETARDHVNRLFSEMRRQGVRQTTARDGARTLGMTPRHFGRLKPLIASDPRFTIVKDPHHKQRHLIRLARM